MYKKTFCLKGHAVHFVRVCLYCMISCCPSLHCGHPLHFFVCTTYLYLPLKAISFSIHHNKG